MPASGARTTRFGTRTGPMWKGSVRGGDGMRVLRARVPAFRSGVRGLRGAGGQRSKGKVNERRGAQRGLWAVGRIPPAWLVEFGPPRSAGARRPRGRGWARYWRLTPKVGPPPEPVTPLRGVALVQQLQPPQRQQVVHLVDRLRERDDVAREPARGDRLGLLAHLRAEAPYDRVDRAGEAVDDAAADRVDRRLADQRARWREVDARQRGRARRQRFHRDLHARGDDAAEVLAVGGDRVVRDRRAEVDDNDRAPDL